MNPVRPEWMTADVVVIGGGIAGMTAALSLSPLSVKLVTKRTLGDGSSSRLAQGGVAVAMGSDDSPLRHAEDTLEVGGGISDEEAVAIITSSGPDQIRRLLEWGARFDRRDGELSLGQEAAHSRRRIVHANGDATGAEIVRVLETAVWESGHIEVVENCMALDLIVRSGRVSGVTLLDREGRKAAISAGATILATGGIGALYSHTTNPLEATGDGIAMAARAGARLVDLEFMQFHPTAIACPENPKPLLTEALRGEGAVLIDSNGDRFMLHEHELAELAPRDVVARAIWRRLNQGLEVYLDARRVVGERFPERFPTVFELCRRLGIDPRVEPVPASPAAHYFIGGIATDSAGLSSLPGLWACGETAATRVHGANRLASNSLLEALVFGSRVAESIRANWHAIRNFRAFPGGLVTGHRTPPDGFPEVEAIQRELREIMWRSVGLIRSEEKLVRALAEIDRLARRLGDEPGEARNMLTVARLVTRSALARKESRGVHYREDYPETDPSWRRHIYVQELESAAAPLAASATM